MILLEKIHEQSERLIAELKWDNEQLVHFIDQANQVIAKNSDPGQRLSVNSETDHSLVTHPASYSGGFILFGGWTRIYDLLVPPGTRGHELYLAFGGLGAGGWSGDCDIELVMKEGTFGYNGKSYLMPQNHYGSDNWDGYRTGFQWFYDHVKSFMFMYMPQFMQPVPIFVYFDSSSHRIGISVPNASVSVGIGGGTVTVKP
ncbi:hypothetical protein [Gaoshiqia sp. Z1-71]|uniref:hypothetical protein n=1 Tax=Gaoshiqia hydrogeniformans TaxID=3290090 RepID=UPI003BF78EF7